MKNKKKPAILRIIFDFIGSHKLGFIVALFCIACTVIGNIAAPLTLQTVVNTLTGWISRGCLKSEIEEVSKTILNSVYLLIGCYTASSLAGMGYSEIMAYTGQSYMNKLRKKLFSHMQDLPVKYFDVNNKGDIMSVYVNDVDTIRQLLINSIPEILICTCTFLTAFFVMLSSSLWLTLIVVLGAVAMFLASKHIAGTSSKNFIAQQDVIGKSEGYVEEMMHGLKVIKSFCHEEESNEGFKTINKKLQDVSYKANSYANILMPVIGNIGNFLYVIVALVGTILYLTNSINVSFNGVGAISVGVIVSFLPLVRQFTNTTAQVANQVNIIALAVGGSERIINIIDEPVEVDDGYVTLVRGKYDDKGNIIECDAKEATLWAWKHPHSETQDVTYTLLKGDIRMFDVDFGYNQNKIVLHNVTLYAEPGQKVAFVGATGAGKTTITNLLNRFYDIADGKIRYDGININKISKKDLRKSLGMVLQDTNLFTGTIMENIRYGKLDATDEECIAAAKLANAHSFIERLPQGYNTVLHNDGSNLSQGQRQLLSIARAAVHDAPVMILDEATSSIDTRTEAIVTEGMDNLMKGRTVFVIAHRLSTIQNSDVIIVLDHGRIIERGSHDELIEKKGVYYQLYTGSFELE